VTVLPPAPSEATVNWFWGVNAPLNCTVPKLAPPAFFTVSTSVLRFNATVSPDA